MFRINSFIIIALLTSACSHSKDKPTDTIQQGDGTEAETMTEVDTVSIHMQPFTADVISNGKVKASEWADIYFRNQDIVQAVCVHNGQRVREGQTLALLDIYKLQAQRTQLETDMEQALIEQQDVLISQGFDPDIPQAIPSEVSRLARIKSGVAKCETSIKAIDNDIALATLTAPFDGVVANVKATQYSLASTAEPAMRILNTNAMSVDFAILESELSVIYPGAIVEVTPLTGGETHRGRIIHVNPTVDEHGHISVRATITNASGLIDGMSVRVCARHAIGVRLAVPKSAVCQRSGRQVVFTFVDGRARWNYVTTGMENFDSYEVIEGLEPNDIVIYEGVETLANEKAVTIRKKGR